MVAASPGKRALFETVVIPSEDEAPRVLFGGSNFINAVEEAKMRNSIFAPREIFGGISGALVYLISDISVIN